MKIKEIFALIIIQKIVRHRIHSLLRQADARGSAHTGMRKQ